MSEASEVLQPFMVAQGVEGSQDLAQRLRDVHLDEVQDSDVEGWMSGTGTIYAEELAGLAEVLNLSREEAMLMLEAFFRDTKRRLVSK
jgi:hypothetical protein